VKGVSQGGGEREAARGGGGGGGVRAAGGGGWGGSGAWRFLFPRCPRYATKQSNRRKKDIGEKKKTAERGSAPQERNPLGIVSEAARGSSKHVQERTVQKCWVKKYLSEKTGKRQKPERDVLRDKEWSTKDPATGKTKAPEEARRGGRKLKIPPATVQLYNLL